MPSESISLDGHIVDSLTLSKVLDIILRENGKYRIESFEIGATQLDMSHAQIVVSADDSAQLNHILHLIQQHGATRHTGEAKLAVSTLHGVFPEGFYVTTNLVTHVRLEENWILVDPIEMDCGVVVKNEVGVASATSVPMHRIRIGDKVVIGDSGVRVSPVERPERSDGFTFMNSAVSSERSKERVITAIAESMREAKKSGEKVLLVGGPAILHTGASGNLEALINAGWIDVLFAGNALATHDIERALYGTSLGVELATGASSAHGHEHHLRAINTIRRLGGIRQAVEAGILKSGIMHALIINKLDFVLAGSIRDDGPLPDVITDSMKAQDRMRELVAGVGVALMVATTLHSVATGNLLPASVRTICVDSDADSVIKLMDRGTHQAFGLVTDCEFFLKELAAQLIGGAK